MANATNVAVFPWAQLDSAIKDAGNRTLDKGGYGTVFQASLNGLDVMIRVLTDDSQQSHDGFWKEVTVLDGLHHHNLLPLMACCPTKLALVYPLMEGGSLADRLKPTNRQPLLWQVWSWPMAVMTALQPLFPHMSSRVP
eukprot:GHUV01039640.1.p1 GENE.GHUV01039640.1~~GHUV01039640.1.p1  ORF type:complete len:139 (+),score=21.72 GHUV01039640.1:756-1172(+)